MPSTTGMQPGGFYDQHSSGQRSSIEVVMPWIEEAAREITLPADNRPITIVDYGCSEGKNALDVIDRAASTLRARGAKQPIVPVLSDLATNNFNQVFRNLAAKQQLAADRTGWFPATVGGSFYGPLLPPGSVHLATTFNSVCWLDEVPVAIDDFVICPPPWQHRPDVNVPAANVAAVALQAGQDLSRFLLCRAEEMVPGARLLVAVPGRDDSHWTGAGLYDLLHDACCDLVAEGKLNRDAYRHAVMPVYFRSQEELVRPAMLDDSPLSDVMAVEKSGCERVPTPFVVEFEKTGDVKAYVEQFVGFLQAFSEPVMRTALESTSSPGAIDAIYTRAKERLAADPGHYPFDYIQVAAVFVRR